MTMTKIYDKKAKDLTLTYLVIIFALFISLFGINVIAKSQKTKGTIEPTKSVIVEEVVPRGKFKVSVKTEKISYEVGELMQVVVRSEESGYLTIYDIQPNGTVNRIFPNYYHQEQMIKVGKDLKISLL